MKKPSIVFMTDFGRNWGAVATMYGVCKQVDNELELFDLTHTIPPFDIMAASSCLNYTLPYWPEGTIFVSVVDPGVGTDRRASVAKTANGYYVVTPDNGTLTHIHKKFGVVEIREIDENVNRYKGTEKVNVFHGRDIFAYCAAKLAAGVISYEQVGKSYEVEEIVNLKLEYGSVKPGYAEGGIWDAGLRFGNVYTSIPVEEFENTGIVEGDMVHVVLTDQAGKELLNREVLYHRSFGYVAMGEPILFNGSTMLIGIGLNQENFCEAYGIDNNCKIHISALK